MATRITEIKKIKIDHECKKNPVYLKWIGKNGNFNYWLFNLTQTIGIDIADAEQIEYFVEDFENEEQIHDWLKKRAFKKMILGASNIETQDVEGIKSIFYSTKVYWLVSQNPNKWQTVLVEQGSFNIIETREDRHDIEFTIVFAEIQTQSQ